MDKYAFSIRNSLFGLAQKNHFCKRFMKKFEKSITLFLHVTKRQTRRTVKTSPAATPVTMTTMDPAEPPKSRLDLLPVTAFESVTPETKRKTKTS